MNYMNNLYVINLKRRQDRMKKMDILLKSHHLNYTRYNAIDGESEQNKNLNSEITLKNKPQGEIDWCKTERNKGITSNGAYGNLLSNIELVKIALKNNYERITIFEDDLIFHKNFDSLIDNINYVPCDWDIIYLGCSQRVGTINKIKKEKYYYKANQSRGTFAYIIKNNMYQILIDLWSKCEKNVDMYMEQIQDQYNCYVMYENLIIADLHDSDIQKSRNMNEFSVKFGWNLNNYLYQPNVSILLPVYNGSNYIRECINSILKQNYYYYELIIINDGSTDDTQNIINSYSDERIKIIINEKNIGIPNTLNIGLLYVKTDYVTWISHDNMFMNNAIKKMANYLNNNNENIVVAGHNYFGSISKIIKPTEYNNKSIIFNFHGIACFMFRTNIIEHIGYYDVNLEGIEDWEYFIRILSVYPYYNGVINEQLYEYRSHDKQKTHVVDIKNLVFKMCDKLCITNYNGNIKNKYISEYIQNNISLRS